MADKKRDRPVMPAGYGVLNGTTGMLQWDVVEKGRIGCRCAAIPPVTHLVCSC